VTDRRAERDRKRRERRKAREEAERRLEELREAWRRRRADEEEGKKRRCDDAPGQSSRWLEILVALGLTNLRKESKASDNAAKREDNAGANKRS